MSERPGMVVLRDERDGPDFRHLVAYLDQDGGLHIDGHDVGPGMYAARGDDEVFLTCTCAAADVPRLIAELGGGQHEAVLTMLERRYAGLASCDLEELLHQTDTPLQWTCRWSAAPMQPEVAMKVKRIVANVSTPTSRRPAASTASCSGWTCSWTWAG